MHIAILHHVKHLSLEECVSIQLFSHKGEPWPPADNIHQVYTLSASKNPVWERNPPREGNWGQPASFHVVAPDSASKEDVYRALRVFQENCNSDQSSYSRVLVATQAHYGFSLLVEGVWIYFSRATGYTHMLSQAIALIPEALSHWEPNTPRIDIKEFREFGFLQEVNRRFLHPLGLALEIRQHEDGTESLGGIRDYRDDPEGIIFGDGVLENTKATRVQDMLDRKLKTRFDALGFHIQGWGTKEEGI